MFYSAYTGHGQNLGSGGDRVERGTEGLLVAHVLTGGRAHGDLCSTAAERVGEIQRSRESIDTTEF
jgi:hypothetical protein